MEGESIIKDNISISRENNLTNNSSEIKDVIEIRKESLINFFKKSSDWIFYFLLLIIVFITVFIRTRNIPNLKDITTNSWTLGPDLDPFLFLRWAEYIVENGELFSVDNMRYVPLGYNTGGEFKLLSYLIAWFHQIISSLSLSSDVTYSAIIFPVFMFAITVVAFYFFINEVFRDVFSDKKYQKIIALISTFFLAVIPVILPRTIAGIPEKESASFLFIFLSFYFFIKSFKSNEAKFIVIYSILAGISTAVLGLIWGGVTFVFMTISISMFIISIAGFINKKKFLSYTIWIFIFTPIMMFFSTRYFDPINPIGSIISFISSTSTIPIFGTWFFILFDLFLYDKASNLAIINNIHKNYHFPKELISLLIVIIFLFIVSIFVNGINFIPDQIKDILSQLVHPFATDRFSLTVAENKQPYFDEWAGAFGPIYKGVPFFFWLFILGSVLLFYRLVRNFEIRDRKIITLFYFIFILSLIFSRYSPNSSLNGDSINSLFIYFGGMVLFFAYIVFLWFKYNKKHEKERLNLDFSLILLFSLFFITIVAARGGVRLMMVLVPSSSVMASYLLVSIFKNTKDAKDEVFKAFLFAVVLLILFMTIFSGYTFYKISEGQAYLFYPSQYNQQWQSAMAWVRNSTPENSVFGHWWDYGYWVQSIGKRATILDGGNAIVYWDHLMGRTVLTASDDSKGLEYLYAHNTTHFLIDSTDIGKYSAYASIGSGIELDRISYLPTFIINNKETQELNDSSLVYAYSGSSSLDEDIVFEENASKKIFIKENSGIFKVFIQENPDGKLLQPNILILENNGQQSLVPIRFLYYDGKLIDFNSGIEAGFFTFDLLNQESSGLSLDRKGAGIYLSKRTVNSFLARKYLFGDESNFKLVHSEDAILVEEIRLQGADIGEFVYFQGNIFGPIKIWEIKYPKNIVFNKSYLELDYPDKRLRWG